jgi:putative membrane protein
MTEAIDYELPTLPALRVGTGRAMLAIGAVSVTAVGFLFWLLYFRAAGGTSSSVVAALPAVNATLNALSSVLLILGYRAVRRRNYQRHVTFMMAAVGSSLLFLVSYVVYHSFHGDTKFTAQGPCTAGLLLRAHHAHSPVGHRRADDLTSLWLSLSGRLAAHRRVSRWTFPIWLYVSVTGVLIFVLLKVFNPPGGFRMIPPMRHTLIATVVFLANATVALACPLCKDSVPTSDAQSAGGLPGGFNNSIYLLLGSLFCVIGLMSWTLVKGARSTNVNTSGRRAFPVIPPKQPD